MIEELYYIQDTRQYVGNCVLWWKDSRCGYTININDAGRFTKEEAFKIARNRDTDKPWKKSVVDRCIEKHVSIERLRDSTE